MAGVVLILASAAAAQQPELVAEADPLPAIEQQKRFRLPAGFRIELVAAEPQVPKPINLRFDAAGRLWVTTSMEYPHPAEAGRTPRDSLRVLVDSDRDGRYDRVSVFAEGLNIPVGLVPMSSSVIAYSIPNLFRCTDADGDGRADQRQKLYGPFGFQDTHGMPNGLVWWLDGWIYGCQGQANTATIVDAAGGRTELHGGCTFRFRPDGARFERFTTGQVNPFGLCIDENGDVFSADSHSRPAYLLLRGGWYPQGAAEHDGLGFAPAIMRHFHGSTGIAGIVRYQADLFPPEHRGTLFIGNPVTRRINHDRLIGRGSSYEAVEEPDFLSCDDPWFRPVDLAVGPDGALYIADFYNRIIGHNEVPLGDPRRDKERGRIWRIVPAASPRRPAPDLTAVGLDELLGFLGEANVGLRVQAVHELVGRFGFEAAEPVERLLEGAPSAAQRASAVWVLHRLGRLEDACINRLAADAAPLVRLHLAKALAELHDGRSATGVPARTVRNLLRDADPFVRRAAADALGCHPAPENLTLLLDVWAETPASDTLLVHTLRMALRHHLQTAGAVRALAGQLRERSSRRRLADVCLGLAGAEAAAFLLEHLEAGEYDPTRLVELLQHCLRHAAEATLSRGHAFVRSFRGRDRSTEQRVLRAAFGAARQRSRSVPPDIEAWALERAREALAGDDEDDLFTGVELVLDLRLRPLADRVAALIADEKTDPALRSLSLDALFAADREKATGILAHVLAGGSETLDLRRKAAEILGKSAGPASRQALAGALAGAPASLASVIAQQLAGEPKGAEVLLGLVEQGKASAQLLVDTAVTQRLAASNGSDLERRLQVLTRGLPPIDETVRREIERRRAAFLRAQCDPKRGALLFQQHCANCHEVGGKGGKAGPQLDGVASRGLDRLLEDLIDPSHAVDARYRSSILTLVDGRVITGLVVRAEAGSVVLVDGAGKETAFAANAIRSRRLTMLSPMPADLVGRLSEQQLNDLVGYLLGKR